MGRRYIFIRFVPGMRVSACVYDIYRDTEAPVIYHGQILSPYMMSRKDAARHLRDLRNTSEWQLVRTEVLS